MKAAVIHGHGSPEVLVYENVPEPQVGPDEVLIAVEVISVEGGDLLNRTMIGAEDFPRVIGYSVAGTIERIGDAVTGLALGQKVCAFNYSGAYAEKFRTVPAYVFPIPDGLDAASAVAIPTTFGTAGEALFEFGQLHGGETVFIHGGAGGVGLAAMQLARAAGARVLATARGGARAARLVDYGAGHGIAYDEVDFAEEVLRLTEGQGADLIIDLAGGDAEAVARLLRCARHRGRLGVIGAASGQPPSIGFWDLVMKSLTVFGLATEIGNPRLRDAIAGYLDKVLAGEFVMPIDREFALADAAAAHRYIETQRPFGRVLLRP
jgi:NADPH:quinone reductase-like Zn-dependent oxidoreductase